MATVVVVPNFRDALAEVLDGRVAAMGVDMPIGLPERGRRAADHEARRRLGPRRSSVFPTPRRAVLGAVDYADALARSRAIDGTGLSRQAFHLLGRIAEVDDAMTPELQDRVFECHPETVFARLAGRPLETTKRTPEGRADRTALLAPHVADIEAIAAARCPGARHDDVLDALAVAVTAARQPARGGRAPRRRGARPARPAHGDRGLSCSESARARPESPGPDDDFHGSIGLTGGVTAAKGKQVSDVKRLTGIDDGFLWMETETSYMHVASLIVVDGTAHDRPLSFADVRALYEDRLDQAPPFRRRLVTVPFGIHHPLWIEDPDFDLDWHLRHFTLPAGQGDQRHLADVAARLVAIPLDRTRPLWEMWYIDGLDDGHVGLLTKVHHAAIDGASGEELMVAILDLEPDPEPRPAPAVPWHPDPIPTDTELLAHATWSLAQQPVKAVGAARRTVEAVLKVREQNRALGAVPAPPAPFAAPATSINGPLTSSRSFAASSVSLTEVKAVKNAFGCTVNDVVMAMCSGAMRRYFDDLDEQLDQASSP